MDLPEDVMDATDAPALPGGDTTPVRSARPTRRRGAPPVGEAAALMPPAADEAISMTDEPVEAAPDPAPVDARTDPVFTPAAIVADTPAEEIEMDTMNADTAADAATDNVKQMADQGVDQAGAVFSDMNGRAKDAMEKGSRMAEELGAFSKGNLEALVESSKIATKGMEAIAQEAAEFSRKSFESATAAMKTLAATRSPTEFVKLQNDYTRSMFDMMVAETTKSTEMMMKLANEIAQPISNRVAIAVEKMKTGA